MLIQYRVLKNLSACVIAWIADLGMVYDFIYFVL